MPSVETSVIDSIYTIVFTNTTLGRSVEEGLNGLSTEGYVEPEIHWHLIKDLPDSLDEDPDDPYSSWGYGLDIDDL